MKARAASPDVLVDLADIGELRGIELGSDGTLDARRDDHLHRHRRLRGGTRAADPRRGLQPDRRRAGSQPRDDRRQRLLERPDEPSAAAPRRDRRDDDDRRAGRRAFRARRGVLPRRLHDCRRARRAADEDLRAAGQRRRLRFRSDRQGRDVHRQRCRVARRRRADARDRLRRRRPGCPDARFGRRRTTVRTAVAAPTWIRPGTCTPLRTTAATSPRFSPYARSPRPQEGT